MLQVPSLVRWSQTQAVMWARLLVVQPQAVAVLQALLLVLGWPLTLEMLLVLELVLCVCWYHVEWVLVQVLQLTAYPKGRSLVLW